MPELLGLSDLLGGKSPSPKLREGRDGGKTAIFPFSPSLKDVGKAKPAIGGGGLVC